MLPHKSNREHCSWCIALILFSVFTIPSLVVAEEVYQTFLKPYRASGVVSARRDILVTLHVKEGSQVQKGQLLAEIDSRVLKARLAQATVAAEATGEITSAKLLVKLRSSKLASLKKLEAKGNARPQELKAAQTNLDMAKAQVQVAREENRLRKGDVQVIEAQIAETKLVSPFDGVVVQVHKHEGELVGGTPGDPVITVIQLDPLLADFHLPPLRAKKLTKDTSIHIMVGDTQLKGEITYISPIINAKSNTIMVRVSLPNPEGTLVSGERVQFTPPLQQKL